MYIICIEYNYVFMKSLVEKINEALRDYTGTYFLLNKSGIANNKKYQKLAKTGGVKWNGEYWFVSAAGLSKVDAEQLKDERHKNDDNFAVAPYDEFENNNY